MTRYNFTIMIEYEDGRYSVQREEPPGAVSQGKTPDEDMANIKGAIEGCVEAFLEGFQKVGSKAQVKNKVC